MPEEPRRLACYIDDCWEPEEAAELLHRLASESGAIVSDASPYCLRVVGNDVDGARLVRPDDERRDEPPGTASYLWALCAGSPPTREWMIALYREAQPRE
jgi:hypothetical protein